MPDADYAVPAGMNRAQRAAVWLVRLYQVGFSPLLGGSCRFVPSCSVYAIEAIQRHGALRGGVLAVRRLARCRPFAPHGFDPVPPAEPPARLTPVGDRTAVPAVSHD